MRLDHLLSKETSDRAKVSVSNILRSVQDGKESYSLFNLEGTEGNVPKQEEVTKYGPIAQLARAHD